MKTYLILIGLFIPVIASTQVKENNKSAGMVKVGNIFVDKYEAPNIAGEVPFVMFTYIEAENWCLARGKRLLLDDEWELVAGGPLLLPYVYGTTYNSQICNDSKTWITYNQSLLNMWPIVPDLNNINTFSELIDTVKNISAGAVLSADHVLDLYQADTSGSDTNCVSYYGVYDLNGNVSEWTTRSDGGSPGFHGKLKGGYWAQSSTIQSGITSHGDNFRFYQTGFRCAKECINTTDTITDTSCDNYTAPDGTVYNTSGIKTAVIPNKAGCDSTITINLTIKNSNTGDSTAIACDSFTWNDTTYTTSGTPTHIFQNVSGCDSSATLHLTIKKSSASTLNESACNSYTAPDGIVYNTSGIKTAIIQNAAGCDSTITINLTINTEEVSVTVNDPTITANAIGAGYQWVDCDNGFAPINGQVNQSFVATANGNYAVIITQGLCADTSACAQIMAVGIASPQNKGKSIHPNPVTNELIIEFKGNKERTIFEILSSTGQIIFNGNMSDKTVVQTTNFAPGIYLIKFQDGSTFEFMKIEKE
jgi:hypothetical protein